MKAKAAFALLALIVVPLSATAYTSPGSSKGFVNDFAQVLTADQKNALERKLEAFERESSNEITVVTIPTLGGDTIENYAVDLFKEWGIGKKAHDNGALLLIAVDDRKMRIETGYGLEGALTDAVSSDIIRNTLAPAFRNNDFYGGIDKAIDSIMSATRGEYAPSDSGASGEGNFNGILVVAFFAIQALMWVASILARSRSWWAGGVVGAVMAAIVGFFFGLLAAAIALVILTPLGLLLDFVVSRAYTSRRAVGAHIPWWAGGGRGGGSSNSHFGGFGGGGSGGGGSSGGW